MPKTSTTNPRRTHIVYQPVIPDSTDKNPRTGKETSLAKCIISVTSSSEECAINLDRFPQRSQEGLMSRLKEWIPFRETKAPAEEDIELADIMSQGKALHELCEATSSLRREQNEQLWPPFRLKGKTGLMLIGMTAGALVYWRFRTSTANNKSTAVNKGFVNNSEYPTAPIPYLHQDDKANSDNLALEDLSEILPRKSRHIFTPIDLKQYCRDIIMIRCEEFLHQHNNDLANSLLVRKFMNGETRAKEIFFHGYRLDGVFMIAFSKTGGVLFDIATPTFFILNSRKHYYYVSPKRTYEIVTDIPNNQKFRNFLLSRIPVSAARKYKNKWDAFHYKTISYQDYPHFQNKIMGRPLSFQDAGSNEQLATKLLDGLKNLPDIKRKIERRILDKIEMEAKIKKREEAIFTTTTSISLKPTNIEKHANNNILPAVKNNEALSSSSPPQSQAHIAPTTKKPRKTHNIIVDIYETPYGDKEVFIIDYDTPVAIEHLYPCVIIRENLDTSAIIRQIGKSFMRPITTLGAESDIVHSHNTLKKGCSQPDKHRKLNEMLFKFDYIISQIMFMLPGSIPLNISQSILGPLLILIADDIDKVPANTNLQNTLNEQAVMICKQLVSTITEKQKKELKSNTKEMGSILPEDIRFDNGKLKIKIDNKEMILHSDGNGKNYIDSNQKKSVNYDRSDNKWKVIDDSVQEKASIDNLIEYYKPDESEVNDIEYGSRENHPVNVAARSYFFSDVNENQTKGNFITRCLAKAKIINVAQREELANLIDDNKGLTNILSSPRKIETTEQLLRVKEGELLFFTVSDENFSAGSTSHVIISLGNGRFTGVRNHLLNNKPDVTPCYFTAEQLGELKNGKLTPYYSASRPLDIYAGYPANVVQESLAPGFYKAAQELNTQELTDNIWSVIAKIYTRSRELSPEQAGQFDLKAGIYFRNKWQPGSDRNLPLSSFIGENRIITPQELSTVKPGNVVIIRSKNGNTLSLALNPGEGMFLACENLDQISSLKNPARVISTEQLAEKLTDRSYSLTEGKISVERLRIGSLLGKDSSFSVSGRTLDVRAHGAPARVNLMDPFELAEVIRGLAIYKGVNLDNIDIIHLGSCFGAFGIPPTGKILANLLKKQVHAYPTIFSQKVAKNPSFWQSKMKIYLPSDNLLEPTKIQRQMIKNTMFFNFLANFYLKITHRLPRDTLSTFELLLTDISKYLLHKQTTSEFLQHNLMFSKSTEIKDMLKHVRGSALPANAEEFAERCMDIFTLSEDTFYKLNQTLSCVEKLDFEIWDNDRV